MELFLLFFRRYLFSARAGSIIRTMARICWLATLIGVFSLVVVSSVMNGFNRSIRTKLLSVEPHLTVVGGPEDLAKSEDVLLAHPGVEVHEFSQQDVIIRTLDGRFAGGVAKGLSEEATYNFLNRVAKLRYKKSAAVDLPHEEAALGPHEILMGSDLARDLNVFDGDEIMLIPPESLLGPQSEIPQFERMRIKSLFTTDAIEVDSKLIVFRSSAKPLRFQKSSSTERGLEVRLQNPDDFAKYLPALKWGRVETWADRNKSLFMALRLEKTAMMTFLSLSVLITCFSLITVLILLISQKRKEIGLLMAVGFSRRLTENLFLSIGVFLSSFGLLGGLLLGLVVSVLIEKYPMDILPDIYYDSALPSEIHYHFVLGVAIFCILIALLAAYWPVRLYMRRSPAENLRLFQVD